MEDLLVSTCPRALLRGHTLPTLVRRSALSFVALLYVAALAPSGQADVNTQVTLTVPAGALSITAPRVAAPDGMFGVVRVLDARRAGPNASWTASVSAAQDLAHPGLPDALLYSVGTIVTVGTMVTRSSPEVALNAAVPTVVVTASGISGSSSASWSPTISLGSAGDLPAGKYMFTLTHSVV